MNTYQAKYKQSTVEIEAESKYKAQQDAVTYFQSHERSRKKIKGWDILVVLTKLNGVDVIHNPAGL